MSVNNIGSGSANFHVQQQMQQRRARAADASGTQKTAGEYNQAQYLKELNGRLDATVMAGAWNGKDKFGANRATAMIHPDFLRKMHDDPALGAEYEKKINEWAEWDAKGRADFAAKGMKVESMGMYVDENGKENYHAVVSSSMGSDDEPETDSAKAKDKKSLKEETEEMLKRLDEKRQKEKLEEKRVAEEEAMEQLTDASASVDVIA